MKVVFLEDVPGTARLGDIKEVKPGFARNFLLPRRLALPATTAMITSVQKRAAREARLQEAKDNDARSLAAKLDGVSYTLTAKAGAAGKLFGSVGTADIAAKVAETIGADFERQNVMLAEPIKDLGDYAVSVRLTRNVSAKVNVSVVGEDGTTAADIKARAAGVTPAATADIGTQPAAPDSDSGSGTELEEEDETVEDA
ncbi:MAG TPA: 50S ribosomal protein L9 [Dehalococcoidia bacterium]|nr:50S ribosomal protein L9 [Dehalococcoidia bacterium]